METVRCLSTEKKDNENVVLLCVDCYKNIIMNIGGKSTNLADDHTEWSDLNPKRQIWYMPVYMWILAFKPLIGISQSV